MIKDISPIGGKIEGDILIKITGSEFRDGAKVRIGEKEVTGVVRDEGKRVNAWIPPGSKIGPQDVTVINPDGSESNTLENAFVYAVSPTITKIEPEGGSIGGGTRITITGFNFLSGVEARIGERANVLIDERKAEIVEIDDRKIVVKSLGGMSSQDFGAQDVTVQNIVNPDELFDTRKGAFVYAFSPEIKRVKIPPTGVNPNGGTQIEIIGRYFPAQENPQVLIGGKETMVAAIKNAGTRIITTAPSGNDLLVVLLFSNQQKSGEADVKVSNLINPEELFHILPAVFTYNPRLEASEIEPDSGILDGGTPITITGAGFIEPISIEIGGKDAQDITYVSSKQITAKTPKSEQGGTVNVLITNGDGQKDASLQFTYNPMPIIIRIDPEYGKLAGGDRITISGENFVDKPIVEIGGNKALDIEFISSNEIEATTPPGKEGTHDVIVTNPDGQSTPKPGKYTYSLPPKITDVSPEIGSPSGGTKITISGENFKGMDIVMIDGKSVKFVEVNSSTIMAVTPLGDAGKAMDVVVTNRFSQEAKRVDGFTPVQLLVNDIEPKNGPSSGGTEITIRGDGFIEGAIVNIGGKPAEDIKVESRNLITARTPQNPLGLKDVIVINPNEQGVTPNDQKDEGKFTYYADQPSNIRVYNFPNPIKVGQSTTFRYDPKKDPGIVEIKIFNMAGELMASLSDDDHDGFIPWNDIDIPPGLYPYVFILNGKIEQGQLLLVKRMK